MTYANWTWNQDVGCTAFLSLTGTAGAPTPAVGNGWLHMAFANTFSGQNGVPDGTLPHGSLHGKYRSLVHLVASGSNNNNVLGLMVMCSQEDMRSGQGGAGYGVFLKDAAPLTLQLVKMVDGLNVTGNWPVLVSHLNSGALSATYALEIEWDATFTAVAANGGVEITVRQGTLANFADLAVVPGMSQYIDSSSPLTTTVGEFPAGARAVGFFDGYIDQTYLLPML